MTERLTATDPNDLLTEKEVIATRMLIAADTFSQASKVGDTNMMYGAASTYADLLDHYIARSSQGWCR